MGLYVRRLGQHLPYQCPSTLLHDCCISPTSSEIHRGSTRLQQHCHQHLIHLRNRVVLSAPLRLQRQQSRSYSSPKLLASEIAENGLKIRVNSIAPGVFPSEMTAGESGSDQKSHIKKEKYEKVPAHRPGKDEDMAGAVLFVATNQYLNGQTVAVDGGYILHAGA